MRWRFYLVSLLAVLALAGIWLFAWGENGSFDASGDTPQEAAVLDETALDRADFEAYEVKADKRGLITFILDDGLVPQHEKLVPLFEDHDMVANWSLATDCIGLDSAEAYMEIDAAVVGWETIDAVYEMGWEISSHSATHADMRELAPDEVEAELKRSKEALEAYDPVAFVYPYYLYDEDVVEQVADHYVLGFAGSKNPADEGRNTGYEGIESTDNINTRSYIQANRHTLRRVTLTGSAGNWMGGEDRDVLYEMVDQTVEKDGWLVFALHDADTYARRRLRDLLDYIDDQPVQVGTSYHGIKKFLIDDKHTDK